MVISNASNHEVNRNVVNFDIEQRSIRKFEKKVQKYKTLQMSQLNVKLYRECFKLLKVVGL